MPSRRRNDLRGLKIPEWYLEKRLAIGSAPTTDEIIKIFSDAIKQPAAWPLPDASMVEELRAFIGTQRAFRSNPIYQARKNDKVSTEVKLRKIEKYMRSAQKIIDNLPEYLGDILDKKTKVLQEIKPKLKNDILKLIELTVVLSNKHTGLHSHRHDWLSDDSLKDDALKLITAVWARAGRKKAGTKSKDSPSIRILDEVIFLCTGTRGQSLPALGKRAEISDKKKRK